MQDARANADVPEGGESSFRIGVNVGDIIFENVDIYGDASMLQHTPSTGRRCFCDLILEGKESFRSRS